MYEKSFFFVSKWLERLHLNTDYFIFGLDKRGFEKI